MRNKSFEDQFDEINSSSRDNVLVEHDGELRMWRAGDQSYQENLDYYVASKF